MEATEDPQIPVAERAREAAQGAGDLQLRFDGAVGVHEERAHGTPVGATVVILQCPNQGIKHAVSVRSPIRATADPN